MSIHEGNFPNYYYAILFSAFLIQDIVVFVMGMTMWAFHAKISDPLIGGTYMTLLMTLGNIGRKWTSTVALSLVDVLSIPFIGHHVQHNHTNSTSFNSSESVNATYLTEFTTHSASPEHLAPHETELTYIDGYYVEFVISFILGLFWLRIFKVSLIEMQSFPASNWRCHPHHHHHHHHHEHEHEHQQQHHHQRKQQTDENNKKEINIH